MVTAVGVLEWIQETHLYAQASKQVPLERVAQPLRSFAATVDENINGDLAKKIITDGQHLISDLQDRAIKTASPAVERVRDRSDAACAFVRTGALYVASLANAALSLVKDFQEQYSFAKSNYVVSQLIALICLALSFVVSSVNARFPPQDTAVSSSSPALTASSGGKAKPASQRKPSSQAQH